LPRRLGQHFLIRQSILERIAAAACPESTPTVIEIGPGKGALTTHLLEVAERVVAIEVDSVLVQYLRSKFRGQSRVEIIESDILKTDLTRWGSVAIVGNLPYYITSPIIDQVVHARGLWSRAVFLVQKEVADRLTASPGTRDFGFLSVQTQFFANVEILFTVPPSAFRPPPKVDSAVVRLTPKHELPATDPRAFLQFVSRCFHQKRKTIRNNLLGAYDKALLDSIPETAKRAEQMPIQALMELMQKLNRGK
jgi:16S rRNA (adenine1518-N6/adenine1519-N6)-dimethyltransferase